MIYVYSGEHIGIDGAYIAPSFFDKPLLDAKVVYTDDKIIKDEYTKLGIEVNPITKPKPKKKGE